MSVKWGWRWEYVTRDIDKCLLSVLAGVRIKRVKLRENISALRRDKRNCALYTGVPIKRVSIERGPTVHWTIVALEIVTVFKNVALKTAASAQHCFLPDTSIVRNRANLPGFGKCIRQNFPETSKKWQIWFHKVQSSVYALTSNSWHYRWPRSVYCRSIVFLVIV